MDILGEGAGWSSFTVRERGEKGTHVRHPRNMTKACIISCADPGIFDRGGGEVQTETFFSPQLILQRGGGGGGNGFIAEKTILSQGSRGGPTFSGEVHPRGDPNCYHNNL